MAKYTLKPKARKRPRKFNRRKRKYKPIMNAARPLAIHTPLKFKYCETVAINPGAGVVDDYIFRANSLFDPNYTGTGHQPMGFDQWCPTFYNHWVVTGAKITVKFLSPGTSAATDTYIVGIDLLDSTSSLAGKTTSELMESPKVRTKLLTNAYGGASTTVTKTFSASKFFRVKDVKGASIYRGDSATNPTEDALFHVFCGAANGYSDGASMSCIVTIEYIADMQEPNELSQS